jgi:hypothetical protein
MYLIFFLLPLSLGGWCPWMYCSHVGLLYKPSFGSSHLHRQVPPRLRRSERPLAGKGRTMGKKWPVILPTKVPCHLKGSFTRCKSATWDQRLYFPSKVRHAEDCFVLKNPTALAGFEPVSSGTRGQHATPRPPKPLVLDLEIGQ